MAKKRLTDVPSAKAVRQFLAKRQFDAALVEARKLAGFVPGPESAALLRECLSALAEAALDRKQYADFNRLALDLDPLSIAAGPESIKALGRMYLRGARPRELPRLVALLPEPADAAELRGDWVDRAVRDREPKSLPEEWHPAFAAFRTALGHYEAQQDDKARDALGGIGLGSLLLEWKLWLRGLLAWVAGDDGRALENWARLNPRRLPHRLAAPLRAKADPAWPANPPALREQLVKQYQRFTRKDVAGQLRNLLPELGGKKGLTAAYRIAEALLPQLKAGHPELVPPLANVFYTAMLKRGEPSDLDRFAKTFGKMPDDPQFNRLSAQIFEGIGEPEKAAAQWWGYSLWLASAPWPPRLRDRAGAIVHRKMAEHVAGCDDGRLIIARTHHEDPKKKFPDVILDEDALLLKALGCAPDWEEPAVELMKVYAEEGRHPEGLAFAEKFLAANPDAAALRWEYIETLGQTHRYAEALPQFERLQKDKPFDKLLRQQTAECAMKLAYQMIAEGRAKEAQILLDGRREAIGTEAPLMAVHLFYALATKAKRADDAESLRPQLGIPGVVPAFLMHANAQIVKAKPAEKTAASKAYKATLAQGPSAAEAVALFEVYGFFATGGVEFTGLKGLFKGIVEALVNAAAAPDLSEVLAAELVRLVAPNIAAPKLEKLAWTLSKRFPKNPIFPLSVVRQWAVKNLGKRAPHKILGALRAAKDLVRDSTDPEYKAMEEIIDDLLEDLDPYIGLRNMFDGFL